MTKSFQLVAGHPTLDLINTLDWRFRSSGPEELLSSYTELLRFAEQSAVLTPRQARHLRRIAPVSVAAQTMRLATGLREAAAATIYALVDDRKPPQDAIKKLDWHLRAAQASRTLRWADRGLQIDWAANSDLRIPVWRLAELTAELLTGSTAASIHACAAPQCRWLFLDTSKNHSRRWCDMKICGNRMKARRFKAQHKAE